MNLVEKLINHYKNSAWLPLALTMLMYVLPGIVARLIISSTENRSALAENPLMLILVVMMPLLVVVSTALMALAGVSQMKRGLKFKGSVNLFFSGVILLVFIVPVILFLMRPFGMAAVTGND